jgi:hypothetical protein
MTRDHSPLTTPFRSSGYIIGGQGRGQRVLPGQPLPREDEQEIAGRPASYIPRKSIPGLSVDVQQRLEQVNAPDPALLAHAQRLVDQMGALPLLAMARLIDGWFREKHVHLPEAYYRTGSDGETLEFAGQIPAGEREETSNFWTDTPEATLRASLRSWFTAEWLAGQMSESGAGPNLVDLEAGIGNLARGLSFHGCRVQTAIDAVLARPPATVQQWVSTVLPRRVSGAVTRATAGGATLDQAVRSVVADPRYWAFVEDLCRTTDSFLSGTAAAGMVRWSPAGLLEAGSTGRKALIAGASLTALGGLGYLAWRTWSRRSRRRGK